MRVLFSWTNHLLKVPCPHTIILGIKFSTYKFSREPTFSLWQFSSVQLLSRVRLFETPWITACQASLSTTISRSSLRLICIVLVMPFSHLILCCPLLLLPPISPSIRVFSNESTLRVRWPKFWSFSFNIIPSKEIPGLISFRMEFLASYYFYNILSQIPFLKAAQIQYLTVLEDNIPKINVLTRLHFFPEGYRGVFASLSSF